MESIQTVIIGAGVIGLAIARQLSMHGQEVVILEAESAIGQMTSSRNSEVIHAGIYYPPNSLKAKTCVEGKNRLYEFCASHQIPHKKIGKLIAAIDDEEIPKLKNLLDNAIKNNVNDLKWLSKEDISRIEPELNAKAALWSPSTGIIDSHQYMLALLGDAETKGAQLALNSQFIRGNIKKDFQLEIKCENEIYPLQCSTLINCAGLNAWNICHHLNGFPARYLPDRFLCKGNYFIPTQKVPFKHLIYPLPNRACLGVHSTLDLANNTRFGPNTQWVDDIDYDVDPKQAEGFYPAIRRYWPDLQDNSLTPAYSGIRPKIVGPDQPAADFLIQSETTHGIPGLINCFAIESPGLTASLSLAEKIKDLITSN